MPIWGGTPKSQRVNCWETILRGSGRTGPQFLTILNVIKHDK